MGVTTPVVGIGGVTGVCLVVFAEAMMLIQMAWLGENWTCDDINHNVW